MRIGLNSVVLFVSSVAVFFPFVSPYPIGTDLQPIFFIAAFCALILCTSSIKVGYAPAFIPILVLSAIYFDDFIQWNALELSRFSFALIAYLFFFNFPNCITPKKLLIVSLVWLVGLAANTIAPNFYISLVEPFLYDVRNREILVRGAVGFAPEPGFSGLVAVSILSFSAFLREFRGQSEFFWVIFFSTLASVVLTRSGAGSLYLVIFCLLYFIKRRNIARAGFVLAIILLVANYVDLGRGLKAPLALLTDPVASVRADASIGTRVLNTLVGVFAVADNPLGYGFGEYEAVAKRIAAEKGLHTAISGDIGSSSNLGRYSLHLGIFWWLFLLVMFGLPIVLGGIHVLPFVVIAFILMSTSVSIAFPITWGLLAVSHLECLKRARTLGAGKR